MRAKNVKEASTLCYLPFFESSVGSVHTEAEFGWCRTPVQSSAREQLLFTIIIIAIGITGSLRISVELYTSTVY